MFHVVLQIAGIVLIAAVSALLLYIVYKLVTARLSVRIGLRNLVRQFRRNLLLGIGIAVGMCILFVTTSFTSGLTDIIFNKIMVYMTGHMRVMMAEYTTRRADVIRDKPRAIEAIRKNVEGIKSIDEDISAFAIGVGNGKTSMLALVGISRDSAFYSDTDLEAGSTRDMYKKDVFPGIVLYKNAARDMNVGMNDIITVRFETVYGQSQAPKFKIVGLIPSQNMFMDVAAYVDMETLRTMLNLKPEECLGLNIVTTYPEDRQKVIAMANRLHGALEPQAAGVMAELANGTVSVKAPVLALKLESDPQAFEIAKGNLKFVKADLDSLAGAKDGVILTQPLSAALHADTGSTLTYRYTPKYSNDVVERKVVVKGIIKPAAPFDGPAALANENLFYDTFFRNIPKEPASVSRDAPIFKALLPEWDLLERSKDTDSSIKKQNKLNTESWKGAKLDVQTMYETASMIIDFQLGLNIISVVAVFILFFVILIGVVNTMRMSIRERTREIGTNRAIGMQRTDVRWVFVFEIVLLAFFACLAGTILGYGFTRLLSSFTIDLKDNPFSMFFVNKHLYFVPTLTATYMTFGIIMAISYIIAHLAARRAANLGVAEALRHYE